jgi:DNA invertase Pin-like site-specific DNA recombinase
LHELRQFASQRGYEIVEEYTDHGISGTKARRPSLNRLLKDANRHRFDVVLVWSCDRLVRSTKHFIQVLDEWNDLGIQFLSQREAIDTDGPLGRAIVVIVSAVAELERSLIGRAPLDVDRIAIVSDRQSGLSLTQVA